MNTEKPIAEKPGIRKSAARKPTAESPNADHQSAIPTRSGWLMTPKTGIRAASYALAFCLILTAALTESTPAYAGEERHQVTNSEISFYPKESSASAESEVTGHIKVELLSVEMPAGGLEFEVNTSIPFQVESPGEQIQSPGICIRNRSVVPIKLEIYRVAEVKEEDVQFSEKFSAGQDQSFRLVDKISEVGPPGTAILVLGLSGKAYSESAFEKDAIVPDKQNIFLTDIPAEAERTLELYGKVAPDFYGAYQFTVRPTLKISAVKATDG